MTKWLRPFAFVSAIAASAPALAHPGHPLADSGLLSGLLHPMLGLDHLLTMLMVGLWAAQLGGRARLWVPASFLALMLVGAGLAMAGWMPPHMESGIAVSLIVGGLLVAMALRLSMLPAAALVGVFAVFHGAAHGAELPATASPVLYGAGFLLATGTLHLAGGLIGTAQSRAWTLAARAGGVLAATLGCVLALA
ncbi:MAG: HupE/UreJ family protein [Pseudomonadota bacterium]|nr:HupE/UreJ family protein [Pseudomonadota bacterium]